MRYTLYGGHGRITSVHERWTKDGRRVNFEHEEHCCMRCHWARMQKFTKAFITAPEREW